MKFFTQKHTKPHSKRRKNTLLSVAKKGKGVQKKITYKRADKSPLSLLKVYASRYPLSKRFSVYISIFLLASIGVVFMFSGSLFRVDSEASLIVSRESDLVNVGSIVRSIADEVDGQIIFTIQSSDLLPKIRDQQPNISRIDLSIGAPNKIIIHAHSFDKIWQTQMGDTWFFLTQNGVLVPSDGPTEGIPHLKIFNDENMDPSLLYYSQQLDEGFARRVTDFLLFVSQKIDDPYEVGIFPKEGEVHLVLEEGARIMFDLSWDPFKQFSFFQTAWESENLNLYSYLYIDARILGRIYTCAFEHHTVCAWNLAKIYPQLAQ